MKSLLGIRLCRCACPGFAPRLRRRKRVTVFVNGRAMNFKQPPIERAGRVFVPLRGIFEQLGATVVYTNGQINATGARPHDLVDDRFDAGDVDGQPHDARRRAVHRRRRRPSCRCASSRSRSARRSTGTTQTSTVTITGGGGGGYAPRTAACRRDRRRRRDLRRPPYLVSTSPTGYDLHCIIRRFAFAFDRPVTMSALARHGRRQRESPATLRQNNPSSFTLRRYPGRSSQGPHHVRVYGHQRHRASVSTSRGTSIAR